MIHNKQLPWQMAQARKFWVAIVTAPLVWSAVYWRTWYEVYREPKKDADGK